MNEPASRIRRTEEDDHRVSTGEQPPILITGSARTGSNLWRAMLNQHPRVFIAQEFQLWFPHRRGFLDWFERLGDLHEEQNFQTLFDEVYTPHEEVSSNSFWWRFWKRMDDWVPRPQLEAAFRKTDRSASAFVETVLRESARHAGASRCGAKNLAHIGFLPTLKRWFPAARVLHLVRDPRAIYASQVRKKASDLQLGVRTKNPLYRLVVLAFVTMEWWWTYVTYLRYRGRPGYMTCRFEDVMERPQETVHEVCHFLDLEPVPDMLQVPVKASSYQDDRASGTRKGIDRAAKHRWKKEVGWLSRMWLRVLCYPGMRAFGYL